MRKVITVFLGVLAILWIAYTLFTAARSGSALVSNLETTVRLMSVRNGDELHSAVGLTYQGLAGAALLVGELLAVAAALVLSIIGTRSSRVAALLVLIAWSALWLGNALWLQRHGWDRSMDVIGIAVGMGVVTAWACLRLPRKKRPPASTKG